MTTATIFSDQRYDCVSCAKGCKTPWKIKVGSRRVEEISKTARYREAERKGYTPLPLIEGQREVGRREDGACVFLEDKLCGIHSELGFQAKPQVCQLFPFFNVDTPGERYFSVSFTCTAVVKNYGRPVEEHLPSVREILLEDSGRAPMPADTLVPLSSKLSVEWPQYLELEKQLLESWDQHNPIKSLLLAAVRLLEQSDGNNSPDLGAKIESQELVGHAIELVALASLHTIAELEDLESEVAGFRGISLREEDHSFTSLLLSAPMPTFQFLRPEDPDCTDALHRYFKNLVIGKQLIHGGTLVARLLQLAGAVSIHLYYLNFQRKLESLEEPTFEHLLWAFDLIEARVMTHSHKFVPLFADVERTLLKMVGEANLTDEKSILP